MKKVLKSLTFQMFVAAAICLCFVLYSPLRIRAALPQPVFAAKTASDFKKEASLYRSAMQAVTSVSTTKLDTADALKQGLLTLEGARANLQYFFSSLVVLAMNDATLVASVKKVARDEAAAENLLKDLINDVSNVQKIDGSKSLADRMKSIADSDGKVLVSLSSRLKSAADAIKKTGRSKAQARLDAHHATPKEDYEVVPLIDPVTSFSAIALAVGLIVLVIFAKQAIVNLYDNLFSANGRDKVAACQAQADDRLLACNRTADQIPFPFDLAARSLCYAQWAIDESQCLVKA